MADGCFSYHTFQGQVFGYCVSNSPEAGHEEAISDSAVQPVDSCSDSGAKNLIAQILPHQKGCSAAFTASLS